MGQIIKLREYPDASYQRRDGAQRGHALHDGVRRCRQGALGALNPRHGRSLLPLSDARRLDERFPGAGQADDRRPARKSMRSPVRAGRARSAKGVTEYKSPTSIVWILGRIYCTGTPEDYKAVHAIQDQCKLVPLSAYGKA